MTELALSNITKVRNITIQEILSPNNDAYEREIENVEKKIEEIYCRQLTVYRESIYIIID